MSGGTAGGGTAGGGTAGGGTTSGSITSGDITGPGTVMEVRKVRKAFGSVQAVAEVSMTVAAGQVVGLLGPNGAGKSTLFGIMAGELPPDSGSILVGGHNVTSWDPWKRRRAGIGRTFQVPRTFERLTVSDHIAVAVAADLGNTFCGWRSVDRWLTRRALAKDRGIIPVLEMTGLADLGSRVVGSLSFGERKRVEIAAVLAQRPGILLMDEPTAGISAAEAVGLVELLEAIRTERPELAIVLTSHDMDVFFRLADEVLLMLRGSIALRGAPDYVRTHETTIDTYLGSGTRDRRTGKPDGDV
jgi:branched-chain amino acid transport system ATP-binding protein